MIRRGMLVLLLVVFARPLSAQKLDDLLKEFGKQIEKAATEQLKDEVDRPCRDKQGLAAVDRFDEGRSGTWAVTTSDRRKYQVKSLKIAGQLPDGTNPSAYLDLAEFLDFSLLSAQDFSKTYRVSIRYRDIFQGESVAGQIVAAAANRTVQARVPGLSDLKVFALEGKSLRDEDWCLPARSGVIDDVRLIP